MIRKLSEFDNATDEFIYYELKPDKKGPFLSPYFYDQNILDEFYIAHKISDFPKITEARLLKEEENWDYGLYVKFLYEQVWWLIGSEELGVSWCGNSRYQGKKLPKREEEPKTLGIRPALVLENGKIDKFKFKSGDLLFCSKRFDDPYREDRIFQDIYFFSFLSDNLLYCDECIADVRFDPFLKDFSEINEKIDEWYIQFIDCFSFEL